jgi:hypothetical protein
MRFAWMVCILVLAACGGDDTGGGTGGGPATSPDGSCVASVDPNTACGTIVDSACSALVVCKANTPLGGVYTAAFCQQVRSLAVQQCAQTVCATSQADVDACASALGSQPCTEICGQVPVEPMACAKLVPNPNMNSVTCMPP